MLRRSMPSDLIRGWNGFSEKIMLKQKSTLKPDSSWLKQALTLKILWLQFDRHAVRCAICGVIPGVARTKQGIRCRDAFFSDQLLQRRKPVPVIGRPGVGIARCLGALDLPRQRIGPFAPCK